jgi:hypothetical protein
MALAAGGDLDTTSQWDGKGGRYLGSRAPRKGGTGAAIRFGGKTRPEDRAIRFPRRPPAFERGTRRRALDREFGSDRLRDIRRLRGLMRFDHRGQDEVLGL